MYEICSKLYVLAGYQPSSIGEQAMHKNVIMRQALPFCHRYHDKVSESMPCNVIAAYRAVIHFGIGAQCNCL